MHCTSDLNKSHKMKPFTDEYGHIYDTHENHMSVIDFYASMKTLHACGGNPPVERLILKRL